jgi:hypothetical protein
MRDLFCRWLRAIHRRLLSWGVLILLSFAAEAAAPADLEAPSPWSKFITLRSGPGYKDNVTLASQNPERSAFWINGGDIFVLRTPKDGPHLAFFVSAEDIRYFSSSVDDEQLAIATAEISKKVGDDWKFSLTGMSVYNDGVFDASSTTTNRVVQVTALSATIRPQIIRYLPNNLRLELRAGATRQYFDEPLDDYWEGGPRLLVGWQFKKNSDLTLSYDFNQRAYDNRRPLSRAGFALLGTLEFQQHEAELQFTYTFDEKKKWRLVSKAAYERNLDNGEGYFDYHRYKASEALRFRAGDLELQGTLTASHYDYDLQPVTPGGDDFRHRTLFGGGLEAQYSFTEKWSVYAEWNNEQNLSNDPFDEYSLNEVTVGVELNF